MKILIFSTIMFIGANITAGTDNAVPETIREFATGEINKDAKMQGESPALPEKIEMANAPEQTKGTAIYKLQYSGYRISCSLQLTVKKDKIKKNSQRCWNHFGDDSNPMP